MEPTGKPSNLSNITDKIEFELSLSKEANQILNLPFVRQLGSYNAIIAGGTLTSVFSSNQIQDIDVFFPNELNFTECNKYLIDSIKGTKCEWSCIKTKNAITYNVNLNGKKLSIQLIKRYFGNPQEIIGMFDFTACQAAFDAANKSFTFAPTFLKDLCQKKLVVNVNYKHPVSMLFRIDKYAKKGFAIDSRELFKVGICIARLEIKTAKDLIEAVDGFYVDFDTKNWIHGSEIAALLNLPNEEVTTFLDLLEKQRTDVEHTSKIAEDVELDSLPF